MRELGHGLQEHDAMQCRSCGNEERASEGTPCQSCGTFVCLMCQFKGITRCAKCDGRPLPSGTPGIPRNDSIANEPSPNAASQRGSVTAPMNTSQSAPTGAADAPPLTRDEDALFDQLFDQLSSPDDRPTP